jgi:ribosomal protein S11
MVKYKYLKLKKFYLGVDKINNKIAKIYIKKTYTNIFVTLCDLKNKVIICKTSGSSDKIYNKRKKRIAQAVEKIIFRIKKYLKLYKIMYIHLIIKMKVKSHVYTLLSKLHSYGIKILSIKSKKIRAHNGVKGRKLRRL